MINFKNISLNVLIIILLSISTIAQSSFAQNSNAKRRNEGDDADTFVVEFNKNVNIDQVRRLASLHNFEVKKQIGTENLDDSTTTINTKNLNNHFILKSLQEKHIIKRRDITNSSNSVKSAPDQVQLRQSILNDMKQLRANPLVEDVHQEKVKFL
jgi:hypothetical protein